MTTSALIYLAGMAALFVGERLLEAYGALRATTTGLGLLAVGGAAVARHRRMHGADDEGAALAQRTALALTLVGAGSLAAYALSTGTATELLGLSGESADRWRGVWAAIWPVVWLLGTLPLVVVDRILHTSPVVIPPRQVRQALEHGLTAALGLALVCPVNYLASQHGLRWHLAHFETARPGPATDSIVSSFDEPVHVYAFLPPNSELGADIDGYFEVLSGPRLTYRRVDHAARPRLARQLGVRENGRIVFTTDDPEDRSRESDEKSSEGQEAPLAVETLEIGTSVDEAEKTLEQLDRKVQQKLVTASRGDRTAYLTTGHGEFAPNRRAPRKRRLQVFERVLESAGFRVRTLGVDDGLGSGVPEAADLVAVVGPRSRFREAERRAVLQFLERGGALLLAVEPAAVREGTGLEGGETTLLDVTDRLGVRLGDGLLAADRSIVATSNNRRDRLNLATDQFTSHPTTASLVGTGHVLFTPSSGHLEILEETGAETNVTVHSPSSAWVDHDGDLAFDGTGGESRGKRPVVAVSTRGGERADAQSWRTMITAGAGLFSDRGLSHRANRQFLYDSLQWLVGTEQLGGENNSEQDIRIRHTREGQSLWFYSTVVGLPLLLMLVGAVRVRTRRRTRDERTDSPNSKT